MDPTNPATADSSSSGRCSGHCCHSFSINLSPGQILDEAKRDRGDPQKQKDVELLAGMLIYHGQFRTNPLLKTKGESWAKKGLYIAQREDDDRQKNRYMEVERLGDHPFNHDVDHRGSHWYGCRHIQLNGDCGIYETRPSMCRKYPNGSPCQFDGCTMSEEEQKKHFEEHWPNTKVKSDDFVQELADSIAAVPDKAIKVQLVDPKRLTKKVRAKR